MTIPIDPKWVADSEKFARLRASGQAWLADLEATYADMQRHLDSPMARFLLPENEAHDTVSSDQDEGRRAEGALSLLQQLETCTTQGQICEALARGGDSTVDLNEAAVYIRKAGLSTAKTDHGLRKNLGSPSAGEWPVERESGQGLRAEGDPSCRGF